MHLEEIRVWVRRRGGPQPCPLKGGTGSLFVCTVFLGQDSHSTLTVPGLSAMVDLLVKVSPQLGLAPPLAKTSHQTN